MLRVIAGLMGLLLLSGCAATQDPRWWASVTAARQAATEKRTADAESQWRHALAEAERSGPDSWRVAYTLQELARFYASQRRNDKAEQALTRALAIHEKIAPRSPALARTLIDLAHLYHSEGRYSEAEPLYERALPIAEACFGPTHRNVQVIVYLLANLYANEGKYADAERLYKRLVVDTAIDHQALEDLARLYEAQWPACGGRTAPSAAAGIGREDGEPPRDRAASPEPRGAHAKDGSLGRGGRDGGARSGDLSGATQGCHPRSRGSYSTRSRFSPSPLLKAN